MATLLGGERWNEDSFMTYDNTSELTKEELLEIFKENYEQTITRPIPDTENASVGLMGWICPKCGTVMGPFEPYCIKCSSNFEITCNGTGTPPPQTYCALECNEDYNIALLG